MQLVKRFFAINAVVVLVTIIITLLAALLFVAAYSALSGFSVDGENLDRLLLARATLLDIQRTAQNLSFEQLTSPPHQERLVAQAVAAGAELFILKNRQILFSTSSLSELDISYSLMHTSPESPSHTLELAGQTYLWARTDYPLPGGEEGVLLLLAPIPNNYSFPFYLALFTAIIFGLTFLSMNAWVSYRFFRQIIAPLSRLKKAANQISQGDLNWEIGEEGEGEIRELARTLEMMRLKLKESIHMQQKYDENRTFLISSISHDLKTPVTSIIGYIDGIRDGVARTPEKIAAYLDTARSKALQVNALIDDLLLYSRLDMNQIRYHFERTDLTAFLEDCLADNAYDFKKANISLSLTLQAPGPQWAKIDREKLKRAIQNILDNAKKYMDKGEGRVEIILRETPSTAVIEIKDNGKGVAEEDLPHIFDRFYRADPARRDPEGSGLGLAIAKQIVEDHGGHIWAKSRRGEGTSLLIALPKEGGVNEKNINRGR